MGYPTETDWRWDGSAGTFMVFTTGGVTGCSTAQMNHGYAVWTGTAWQVQYGANGCPKLFTGVQAMHPLHLTGVRYKMYYGNPTDLTGKITTSNLPFLGPKMLIYADGARTGDATRVDFEDWESVDVARRVTFLWPDGTTLNATANGYIAFAAMLMAQIDGIKNKIDPGEAMDKNLYDLPAEELAGIPTVCGSLREALDELQKDMDFLLAGDVFTKDQLMSYIDLKAEENQAYEMCPHPIEYKFYYSC